MSHTPVLSASNTLPAASNGTSSSGTLARRASSAARSAVTPLISPPSFCASTELPRLIAARSFPVGARSFTTSGVSVLMVPLWVMGAWADAATVAATIMVAVQMARYISFLPLCGISAFAISRLVALGSGLAGAIEKLQHPRRHVLLRLLGHGDVPVLGARQAFLHIARRRGRVRGVAAGDDQGRNFEAHQILRLGARCGVAVEQRARHAGHDEL